MGDNDDGDAERSELAMVAEAMRRSQESVASLELEGSADDDVAAAVAVSLAEADEALLAREARANEALASYGRVRLPCGLVSQLFARREVGDGFCFMRSLVHQLGGQDAFGMDHRELAYLSLLHVASHAREYMSFVSGEETAQRLRALGGVGAYERILDIEDEASLNFHAYLLDMFESILVRDVSDPRRYADHVLIDRALKMLQLRAFVFKVVDPLGSHCFPAEGEQGERGDVAGADLFMVHYERSGAEHYDSASAADGTP